MTVTIDSAHTWAFTVGTTTYWPTTGTVRMSDSEGGEIDTLAFELNDSSNALSIGTWQEVTWVADGTTYLFGGYVTSVGYQTNDAGSGRVLSIDCESYVTRLHKVPLLRATYLDTTPGAIAAALFTAAGVSDFDTATHVTAGTALTTFTVDGETLAEALDRLALVADFVWRVDGEKNLWFGAASSDPAPFEVADVATVDYATVFPAEAGSWTHKVTAAEPRNKVTVHGGYKTSDETTETFSGDGSETRFKLAHQRIARIIEITVGGVRKRHGTLGWHDYVTDEMDVLTDYVGGYLVFGTPPASGTNNVSVTYQYQDVFEWTDEDAASIAAYGLTFWYHYWDSSVTNEEEAQDIIDAILADSASDQAEGSFSTMRLGLLAGQQVALTHSKLGVTGNYVIRRVTYSVAPATGYVICDVTYGGRSQRLTNLLNKKTSANAGYPYPSQPEYVGEIEGGTIRYSMSAGTGIFTPP